MISGDGWDLRFPDICLTVEKKPRKKPQPRKLTRQGIEHGPARWKATMLPLGHSGGLNKGSIGSILCVCFIIYLGYLFTTPLPTFWSVRLVFPLSREESNWERWVSGDTLDSHSGDHGFTPLCQQSSFIIFGISHNHQGDVPHWNFITIFPDLSCPLSYVFVLSQEGGHCIYREFLLLSRLVLMLSRGSGEKIKRLWPIRQ